MNKTLLFLFVVLSLVSFAASQACNATNSCAGKGKTCVGDSSNPNNCDIKNGTCCAKGLLCYGNSTKTCTNNNIGDSCTSANQCIGDGPVACVKSICQYVYGPGESCSTNTDCLLQVCTNSTSKCGLAVGSSCTIATAAQCAGGSYCGPINNGSLQCVPFVTNGNPCNLTALCNPLAHYCNGTGTGSVCMAKYSAANGGSCSTANGGSDACGGGLYCNGSNICVTETTTLTSCTATANCTAPGGGICYCNPNTGNQFCQGLGYLGYNPCDSATKSLLQCLDSSNCQYPSGAPDSCCKASCSSEYKKAQSCGCDDLTSTMGSCGYNSNCGGFPVWAIIVIIVVAIVLVLAIVLLVFFMMRRRRQYDSI